MNINYSAWYNMRTNIKRILIIAIVVLTTLTTVDAAVKTDTSDNEPILTTKGISNGEMTFNLKYNNVKGEKLEIILKDKEGNLLFQQSSREKLLSKTFKVEADIRSVTLTIVNLNSKTEQKFEIFNHIRTTEKLIVTSTY